MIKDGIYAAVLTPLDKTLKINHKLLESHSFDLLQRGCVGVTLFGTTGEGPSFSTQEKIEAVEKILGHGCDPKKLILANGSASIPDTIELASCPCASLLIAPPAFFKNVSEKGVIDYYREILKKKKNLKVLLYHIPQMTQVPITLSIIETLQREFPENIIGIKESEGNLDFTKKILKQFPKLQVFVGNERHIKEAVKHGASGAICGLANLYPELLTAIFRRENRDRELDAIFESIEGKPFIPYCKRIMSKVHPDWKYVRPPLESF